MRDGKRSHITHHASRIILMYRKPRFLEELHAIREEMSRECDYDADLFAEMVRSGQRPSLGPPRNIRGVRSHAPADDEDRTERTRSGKTNE
jgi:hypothetical protein